MDQSKVEDAYYAAIMEGADLASHGELDAGWAAFTRAAGHAKALDGGRGPKSAEALRLMATLRAEKGAYEEALAGLDEVVGVLEELGDDAQQLAMARISRAAVYAAIDQMDGALEDARAAIALLDGKAEHTTLLEHARSMVEQIEAEVAGRPNSD